MGVYKHNNGNWYCRGRIDGERYHLPCTGAKTKEDAKALEDAERYKIRLRQKGLLNEKEKDYTFSFLIDKYLEISLANNKDKRKYKLYANVMLEYFGKNKKIATVKASDVEAYRVYLLSTGKSKATVNRYISALKRAYNILINDELIIYNPVNKVEAYAEDGKRDRYLTKEEWETFKTCLSQIHLDIVMTALLTGYRKQNVLRLNWEQIDLDARIITLLKSENKGRKRLVTYINDKLYEILMRYEPKPSGYVFVNPKTGLPYTDIKKAFNTALKRAGIEGFCFHDLRRTVGTWLLEEGVNIRVIQNLLGHSDISTTERYLSISKDHNVQAMQILNNYML